MRRLLSLLALSAVTGACSSGTGPDAGLSSSAANAFAGQVAHALGNGVQSANFSRAPRGAQMSRFDISPDWSHASPFDAAPIPRIGDSFRNASFVQVNVNVQTRTNCTAGGYIEVAGSMTGSISDQGTGALLLQVLETISDWRCVGSYVVNGDPYISAAGTFSFLNGNLSEPASISVGGGFKWGGTAAQSCQMQMTVLAYSNGTGRYSGTVCNHAVNQTF